MIHRCHQAFAFEPKNCAIPGVTEATGIGYNIWTRRRPHELGGHAHEDHWEIHYLVHGQIMEEVAGTVHVMTSGDILIAPPGIVHTGINHVRHRCGLCWLGIRLPERASLSGMSRSETDFIRKRFRELGSVPFAGDPGLLPAFSALMREAGQPGEAQGLVCRGLLQVILALLTRPTQVPPGAASARTPEVASAVALLGERLEFPLRISSLFPRVGLRRSAFTQRFIAEMGVSPLAYRTQLRLEAARSQVASASNREVARRFGFSSPQHFVTMFRRSFGLTPGAFRKQARSAGGVRR
jgi:AraC-like DNA-binding protein